MAFSSFLCWRFTARARISACEDDFTIETDLQNVY
jgi:hypothetical protein